ncbi:hypothetical protein HK102_013345 [Quaeritorhiza haematococci]|nr:hypothetical protein HK102_013345 [Quaeritorhiza haematococci]
MNTSTADNATAGTNGTAAAHGMDMLMFAKAEFFLFVTKLQEDPVKAVFEIPPFVAFALAALVLLPPVLRYVLSSKSKQATASLYTSFGDDDFNLEESKEKTKEAPSTEAIWQIGVTNKAIAVSEEGLLRLIDFVGPPITADDICHRVLKAITNAADGLPVQKPRVIAFLESRRCSAKVVNAVAEKLKEYDIRASTMEELAPEMEELAKKRKEELAQKKVPQQKPDFQEQPPRSCFICRKQITQGKPSQCSACKAIIYCGAACAKKDWPQHKLSCASFKKSMRSAEEKNLHDLPFTYYNKTKQLQLYNAVIYLIHQDLHNIGLYKRLCHCYAEVAYGELAGEMKGEMEKLSDPKEKHAVLGLPDYMYPLSNPLPPDVDPRSIDSWAKYCEVRGIPFDSVVPMILETPLTVFHLLNNYFIPKGAYPKKFVVHMIGVEKEADLAPLFEVLLPLFPGVELHIHMIGPAISKRLHPSHKTYEFKNEELGSSLRIVMGSDLYGPDQLEKGADPTDTTTGKPDAVIALNVGIFGYQSWVPSIKMLVERRVRVVFTEFLEETIEVVSKNLKAVGAGLSVNATPNPFKQPIHRWNPDNNFPSWSNGFIFAIN